MGSKEKANCCTGIRPEVWTKKNPKVYVIKNYNLSGFLSNVSMYSLRLGPALPVLPGGSGLGTSTSKPGAKKDAEQVDGQETEFWV